ncbi:MAG: hypothetical protein NT161_01790 [Candidatus Nomurabacteria bacterium]|nr:hypothetical protein [Candidatus Nomurabacteria bacterium]
MAENLKFLYFGNKKPNNEKEPQKEEEENSTKQAEDKGRLKAEIIKVLTKKAEDIYYRNKSSISVSKEYFIQIYIRDHTKGRSL